MTELVQHLQYWKYQGKDQEVLGTKGLVADVVAEFGPMGTCEHHRGQDHGQPQQPSEPSDQGPHSPGCSLEEAIRIEQRDFDRQEAAEALPELHPCMTGMPFKHFPGIWRHVSLKKICRVELCQQMNNLVLGRSVISQLGDHGRPKVIDAVLPIHKANKQICGGRESVASP